MKRTNHVVGIPAVFQTEEEPGLWWVESQIYDDEVYGPFETMDEALKCLQDESRLLK